MTFGGAGERVQAGHAAAARARIRAAQSGFLRTHLSARSGAVIDPSADRWRDFVGDGEDFQFISEAGVGATPTYQGLFNIDHVISEHFVGDCVVPGITPGVDPVLDTVYFDHHPIVCTVTEPE